MTCTGRGRCETSCETSKLPGDPPVSLRSIQVAEALAVFIRYIVRRSA